MCEIDNLSNLLTCWWLFYKHAMSTSLILVQHVCFTHWPVSWPLINDDLNLLNKILAAIVFKEILFLEIFVPFYFFLWLADDKSQLCMTFFIQFSVYNLYQIMDIKDIHILLDTKVLFWVNLLDFYIALNVKYNPSLWEISPPY